MCADFKYGVLEFSFLKPVKSSAATRAGHFITKITHRENAERSSNSFLMQSLLKPHMYVHTHMCHAPYICDKVIVIQRFTVKMGNRDWPL